MFRPGQRARDSCRDRTPPVDWLLEHQIGVAAVLTAIPDRRAVAASTPRELMPPVTKVASGRRWPSAVTPGGRAALAVRDTTEASGVAAPSRWYRGVAYGPLYGIEEAVHPGEPVEIALHQVAGDDVATISTLPGA